MSDNIAVSQDKKEVFGQYLHSNLDTINAKVHELTPDQYQPVHAIITAADGKTIFEKPGVIAPKSWSSLAVTVAADKYFIKKGEKAESSVLDMCTRVANVISVDGLQYGYFADVDEATDFAITLTNLLVQQYFSFNSPVWFNVGVKTNPQISACFINSIEDSMESILELCKTEGMIYKHGSGSGCNYSPLRGARESLSHGGSSSGVLSFMLVHDAVAGSIKSGGTTRRAAKMAILNVDHPDIEDFVACKQKEELKATALIKAGYSDDFRDPNGAYASIGFQNANNSVRVTDEFMRATATDKDEENWALIGRVEGTPVKLINARKLIDKIAQAAWASGDPGLQFDNAANMWNTLAEDGRINGSNPCSEYMSLDNTSCNLASLNLLKFYTDGQFDSKLFASTCAIISIALDILICGASYPTEKIGNNVRRYRQIGLGFANLGALLMAMGLPYDSKAGRDTASAVSNSMTLNAYKASAHMASRLTPFEAFHKNKKHVLRVLNQHKGAAGARISSFASNQWAQLLDLVEQYGLRNSYVTNIAPTGTIGLQMDCSTTGIEPELALVKTKKLVGGGTLSMVNGTTKQALETLGFNGPAVESALAYILDHGTIAGWGEEFKDRGDFTKVFAASLDSKNPIRWEAHIEMMAAVQDFISGSISKTVNMPHEATIDDVKKAFEMAWKSGLKCVAIYRDGCKGSQPLVSSVSKVDKEPEAMVNSPAVRPERVRLPMDRQSITHKFSIGGHEGYLIIGLYDDGKPGEVFVVISKEGSFVSGLVNAVATMISIALQYGAPLDTIVNKLKGHAYEPQGLTTNAEIRFAKSLTDYMARFLEIKFLKSSPQSSSIDTSTGTTALRAAMDAPPCPECGSMMVSSGTCYRCQNCGATTGCS
jgi:ribonucleoside-diphosphate reductase alpha chain